MATSDSRNEIELRQTNNNNNNNNISNIPSDDVIVVADAGEPVADSAITDSPIVAPPSTSEIKDSSGHPSTRRIRKKGEDRRIVHGANPDFNHQFKYHNNLIKTSKYNALTFLPLNLFEQFHRFANIYFLCLVILQSIPLISSVNPVTTVIPLAVVLGLSAFKDLVDDINRHRSDRKINNRDGFVLLPGATTEVCIPWQKLEVGQVVLVRNNQPVPADMLLLSSSDDNGLCFVETVELDGETNLKVRQALIATQAMSDHDKELSSFDGIIEAEAPNNNLNRFEGRLEWKKATYSLNNENILLRGCTVRNTSWVHGLIIFAGKDTKLMKNSGKTKMKKTRLDRLTNRLILCILGFLGVLLIVAAINTFFFESKTGRFFKQYSFWYPQVNNQPAIIAILNMFSFLILIQTVIPISLYVSIEFIRVVLSRIYINSDRDMYHEPVDTPACARTTTLNEELGQIEYIFTDKTGTLTQNIMTFNKCSIAGHAFGDPRPERQNPNLLRVATTLAVPASVATPATAVDFSRHNAKYFEPSFKFYDWSLLEEVVKGNREVHDLFTLLALCHTVIADYENGQLVYKAQSPDEAALVGAARNFGFVYKSRTPNSITISLLGVEVTYDLLCVLDFDNIRKRMSVIVQRGDRRLLMCKGADTLVLGLLERSVESQSLVDRTKAHLSEFAGSGLRTLCCAVKEIDDDTWKKWVVKYHNASTSLVDREAMLSDCYEEIEQNLRLIGATAVEDKLQVGVPETIFNLAAAGIKIWVLTGDKQETAINIGYSSNMLRDTMDEFIVDAEDRDAVEQQLEEIRQKQQTEDAMTISDGFALIINGPSLLHALNAELEQLFLEVACACKTVICCRVTPLQKAMVVSLVKHSRQTVTLAIGDGANDVNMIKTAHIGIGISGQEGMQAVLASDFSFAQFRFLQKLLLVHGRWAYLRVAIFLRYFFFKNFTFTLCHYWFGIYSGWSANSLYDAWLIMCYNLIYTATPIVCYGWFEQDVNAYYSQTYPQLYQPGLRNALFNLPLFLTACIEGIYDSVVTFFIIRYGFADYHLPNGKNILSSQAAVGVAVGTTIVIVATIRCLLEMSYITVCSMICVFGVSLLGLFVVQIAFAEILAAMRYQFDFYGIDYPVWSAPNFWLCCVAIVSACCLPILFARTLRQIVHVSLTDRVRALQLSEQKEAKDYIQVPVKQAVDGVVRRSRRFGSGYAFSQQPGLGGLIQSGVLHESTRARKSHGANIVLEIPE